MPTLNFEENHTLQNTRVLLRPLQITDFQHLLPYSQNEPEIWNYSLATASGQQNLQNYLHNAIQARNQCHEYPFIVFDKKTQQYAGSTRFYDIQLYHKTLQLGYTWYAKKFQGTGLNKHCKYLLLQFAFDTLQMQRVEFRADLNNQRSIYAMKSIGCTVEGILRSHAVKFDGNRRNSIILSILKTEWDSNVKDLLYNKLVF